MKLLPCPRAILFDVGGTLLDENGYDTRAGVRRFLGLAELADPTLALNEPGFCEELERAIAISRGGGEREFRLCEWLAARLEMSHADASVAELAIWMGGTDLSPSQGIETALAELRRAGIRLAAVSNAMFSPRAIGYELGRYELLGAFEFVMTSAEHGVRKPAPSIFRAALERLDVAAEDAWFVGDSWECDVIGAAAAGMRPFWISPADSGEAGPAYHRIERAAEVARFVAPTPTEEV